MKPNKEIFKQQYEDSIHKKLSDFISSEINENTYETIVFFIDSPHLSGTYEGNQYLIIKERNNTTLTIIDEVSEKHGTNSTKTRFNLEIAELLDIISESKDDNFERIK